MAEYAATAAGWIDLQEASQQFRVHPSTLRKAAIAGKLRHKRGVRGKYWLLPEDVARFIIDSSHVGTPFEDDPR